MHDGFLSFFKMPMLSETIKEGGREGGFRTIGIILKSILLLVLEQQCRKMDLGLNAFCLLFDLFENLEVTEVCLPASAS